MHTSPIDAPGRHRALRIHRPRHCGGFCCNRSNPSPWWRGVHIVETVVPR